MSKNSKNVSKFQKKKLLDKNKKCPKFAKKTNISKIEKF